MAESMGNGEFVRHLKGWLSQLKNGVLPKPQWKRVKVDRVWLDITHPRSRHKDCIVALRFGEPVIDIKVVQGNSLKENRLLLTFKHESHWIRHGDIELYRDVEIALYPLKAEPARDKPGTDFFIGFYNAGDFTVRLSFE